MPHQELLQGFLNIERVLGAFLIDEHGQPVAQSSNTGLDPGAVALLTLDACQTDRELAAPLGRGEFLQGYLEFENQSLALEPLPNARLLVVAAKPGSNLGRIRLEMKRVRKLLEQGSA